MNEAKNQGMKINIFRVVIITILEFFVIYGPQPLLPILSRYFSRPKSETGLLLTAIMIPLSLAPIAFGFLYKKISATKLLNISIFLLAILTLACGVMNSLWMLIALRCLQGILLAIIITMILTYIARNTEKDKLQRAMSIYVTSTILGTFFGRIFAGLITDLLDWRSYFVILSVCLFLCFFFCRLEVDREAQKQDNQPFLHNIAILVKNKTVMYIYILIFCVFFVFMSILNCIPFRTEQITHSSSALLSSIMYSGSILGMIMPFFASRLCKYFKHEMKVILIGSILYILSCFILFSSNIYIFFIGFFPVCGLMFLIHPVAITMVNKNCDNLNEFANGLYTCFYYAGGSLGAYCSIVIYEHYSWTILIFTLIGLLAAVLILGIVCKIISFPFLLPKDSNPKSGAIE